MLCTFFIIYINPINEPMNAFLSRALRLTFHLSRFMPFITLLLMCALMIPSGATAGVNLTMLANAPQQEDDESITVRFHLTLDGEPLPNEPLSFSLSPEDGTAFLALFTASTGANGEAMFILQFRENASGTYKVTVRLNRFPTVAFGFNIIYSETSGPTVVSSTTTPPPEPSKLVKISDDEQLAAPGDSVTLIVELQDQDGNPKSGVDLNFILFGDADTGSLDPETGTTDENGRAQTTLILSNDATGEYIVEAYRSDDFGVYVDFTVTIDTSPPTPTTLSIVSGDNQNGFTGAALANPVCRGGPRSVWRPDLRRNRNLCCHRGRRLAERHNCDNRPRRAGGDDAYPRNRARHEHRYGGCRRGFRNGYL